MREITERLHEKRQIELAKSILESNGYKVEERAGMKTPIEYKGELRGYKFPDGSSLEVGDFRGNVYDQVFDVYIDGESVMTASGSDRDMYRALQGIAQSDAESAHDVDLRKYFD